MYSICVYMQLAAYVYADGAHVYYKHMDLYIFITSTSADIVQQLGWAKSEKGERGGGRGSLAEGCSAEQHDGLGTRGVCVILI